MSKLFIDRILHGGIRMKETGIVRKLDDLGRLVIPKEIRKMYKMKEGDSIEIFIMNDVICIRKFDETSSLYEQIEIMCNLLQEKYENFVFFTSEEYLKRKNLRIEDRLLEKAQVHRSTFFENSKLYVHDERRFPGYIVPIVCNGIYYGSFVMVFDKREYKEEHLEYIRIFAQILAHQQHS